MNYYIATKLENHAEHNRLRDALSALGHRCTYDWTHHGPVYGSGLERVREIAQLEMRGVLDADALIMLWPGGRGTHVELGAAIAAGKPCVIVSDVEGHHVASPETCAFYHHPCVTRVRKLEDAYEVLTSQRWNTELCHPEG
jgi:nucleoside 2-deoxyribosyltransferase